jgi:hypothetical protein
MYASIFVSGGGSFNFIRYIKTTAVIVNNRHRRHGKERESVKRNQGAPKSMLPSFVSRGALTDAAFFY